MLIPETVNLHVWPRCNLSCVYCYGRFPTLRHSLPGAEWCQILTLIQEAGVRRVTFSGGEPTLHPEILPMVTHARACGLQTSIITNGARLTDALLKQLDLVGMDLDSADDRVQAVMGRSMPRGRSYCAHVSAIAKRVHRTGALLKLNTVITKLNLDEDLTETIVRLRPAKWKAMQFVAVQGENDATAPRLEISQEEFERFVARHLPVSQHGIWLVPRERSYDPYDVRDGRPGRLPVSARASRASSE